MGIHFEDSAGVGREKSMRRSIRMPESLDEYVTNAVRRSGLDNRSEYVRALIERGAQAHKRELADT